MDKILKHFIIGLLVVLSILWLSTRDKTSYSSVSCGSTAEECSGLDGWGW